MKFASKPAPTTPHDQDAFVLQHQGEVWSYLRVCGCDAQTAEDLTQETFLVVLRKGVCFDADARARAYLRRTARLLFLEASRRSAADPVEPGDAWLDAVDRHWRAVSATEDRFVAALRCCCDRLRGRRRRAVELFYGEQRGRAQVAQHLGMTENGIKTLLQRVRADLRGCIERLLG